MPLVIAICVLLLLLFFRWQVTLSYVSETGSFVVKLLFFTLFTYPTFAKKPKNEKKKPTKKPADENEKKPPIVLPKRTLPEYFSLASECFLELKKIVRKIRFDFFSLTLLVGSDDAAETAILYGTACALYGSFYKQVKSLFRIKKEDVRLAFDYNLSEINFSLTAKFSVRLIDICAMLIHGLKILRRVRGNERKNSRNHRGN